MASFTLDSFVQTLDVLVGANAHSRNKGDDFKNWIKENFDCDARISHVKEQRQITNRVSEQFRYFAPIVVFVCVSDVKRDKLVEYILDRVYTQLENVAIIGVTSSESGARSYTFERLLVFKPSSFTKWAEEYFELIETVAIPSESSITFEDIPITDTELAFRDWMATQKNAAGNLCSASMISNNCAALKKVCSMMDITICPDVQSLFEITDPVVLAKVKQFIKSHDDYEAVNIACSNRYLNTGLNWYERYLQHIFEQAESTPEEQIPYTKDDFLKDGFLTVEEYDELVNLLIYKKNVILQGAPGVGKTFLAKRLAYAILGFASKHHVEMVQFHQSYSYEDFIMGYKPVGDSFELQEGVFYRFCKRAECKPGEKFFFIIDEINRGNLSKVFGELMLLIEHDKRKEQVTLAYRNEKFNVPENVYIIGMMNTADRSLALMDYALRRRFSFFEVMPAFKRQKFIDHLNALIGDPGVVKMLNDRLYALNEIIADEDKSGLGRGFCIGHSYFCSKPADGQTPNQWYNAIVKYEISPLLDEYWWDDKDKANECKKELLGE